MIEVVTLRQINLDQLGVELACNALVMQVQNGSRTITCHDESVTEAELQAAVDSHIAIDEVGNRQTMEQQAVTALQGNRDFLAIPAPTNPQVLAQVKALTRQNNGIIRLILGKLEATD